MTEAYMYSEICKIYVGRAARDMLYGGVRISISAMKFCASVECWSRKTREMDGALL